MEELYRAMLEEFAQLWANAPTMPDYMTGYSDGEGILFCSRGIDCE